MPDSTPFFQSASNQPITMTRNAASTALAPPPSSCRAERAGHDVDRHDALTESNALRHEEQILVSRERQLQQRNQHQAPQQALGE